ACDDDSDDSSRATEETTGATEPDGTTGETQPPADDAGFVFGYIRPAPGLLRDFSGAQEAAISLAVDDINAAGGVNGEPVAVSVVDEPLDGDIASVINGMLDDGVDMILGPVGSNQALLSLETITTRGSVACSASATSPQLTASDAGNVLYRTAMPDSFTVDFVADTLQADAATTVTILARDDDYGINVGNGLGAALTARGIAATVLPYNSRQVIFGEEVDEIVSTNPDKVVIVAYSESTRIVDELVTAGVAADKLIGLDGSFNPRIGEAAFPDDPSLIDGMRVIGSTGGRAFVDRLVEAQDDLEQIIYGAQMYDCLMVGALAADAAGSADPTGFVPQLAAVSADGRACSTYEDCLAQAEAGDDIDYEGVSGGIAFDAAGDPTEVRLTVVGFDAGDMVEQSTTDLSRDDVAQQEAIAAAVFNSRVQQLLKALGYYTGPVDGVWTDEVTAALIALQTDLGVPPTGVYDEATDAALREQYGELMTLVGESVSGIQQLLTDLGYYAGPIDGTYSDETVAAVKALQADLGVPQTGVIDAATLQAAYELGLSTGSEPPPTTVPPDTTVPPNTTTPPTQPPSSTVPVDPPDPSGPTVLDQLRADERFTTLVELIEAAGFTDDTNVLGPFTIFAPTNDAFAAMSPEDLEALKADPERLKQALAYHLVEARLTFDTLELIPGVRNYYGDVLTISVDGDTVTINGVAAIAPETEGRNGVIIPMSGILLPPA
ncbi:MAG TPA: peptidoglycan-binding protein, partial [Ilumatobacteraceae bacterium]|nr:peptidoglycan-binding protein [Ilumatobacteraceae bacterium]